LSKTDSEEADDADTRMSPDPFAVVLPALSALGAIASIAAINWAGQEKTAARVRAKRKTSAALRDLETSCIGLADIFRRFQRHPRVFAGDGGQAAAPLKFGVHGQRIRADAQRLYLQLVNDIASKLVLAIQNAFDVMTAIEDGDIEAPEEIFFGFGEQQERLNALIQTRAPLKVVVDTGADVADRLTELARALKGYQKTG
jgi:adenylosuccinate lyase